MKHVQSFFAIFAIEIFQSETYDEVQSRKVLFSESKTIQTIQFNATLKINMEPKNHPIGKEHHFPSTSMTLDCSC